MKDLDIQLKIIGSPIGALSAVLIMAKALKATFYVKIAQAGDKLMSVSPDSYLNDLANLAELEIRLYNLENPKKKPNA